MTKKQIEVKGFEKTIKRVVNAGVEIIETYERLRDIDTVDPSRRRFEAVACRGRNRKHKRK